MVVLTYNVPAHERIAHKRNQARFRFAGETSRFRRVSSLCALRVSDMHARSRTGAVTLDAL